MDREASDALEEKETVRMEAFSDGGFAFAITLLALNLRDPSGNGLSLSQGLFNEWPMFFALVTSFVTVLIMWMNHHNMFNYIRKIDRRLMLLNGLLLLFVVLTVFNTSLIANHIRLADASVAATLYAGTFFVLSIVWNGLWWYCTSGRRLLGRDVTDVAGEDNHPTIPSGSDLVRSGLGHRTVQRAGQCRGHPGGRRFLRDHRDARELATAWRLFTGRCTRNG